MSALRIVCLSDTHLRRGRGLPDWCRRRLEGADLILHAGDLVALSLLYELEKLAPVTAVYGNMDEPGLKERLPARRVAETGDVRIGLVHDPGPALGRIARLTQEFPDCDAVVFGHTHVPALERPGKRLIVNPGSPTYPRSALGPTLIELSVAGAEIVTEIVTP